jgi:hypothetical protein
VTGGPAPGLWVESYQQSCCDQVSVPQVGTVELSVAGFDHCVAQAAAVVWATGVDTKVNTKRLAVSPLLGLAAVCCTSHTLSPAWLPAGNVTFG